MEQCRIEEESIAFLKWELNHHLSEDLNELGMPICDVAVIEMLGEWEELGWTGIDRHVGMSYRTLESEELRCDLGNDGKSSRRMFGLETEVYMSICWPQRDERCLRKSR